LRNAATSPRGAEVLLDHDVRLARANDDLASTSGGAGLSYSSWISTM
jgi:hypothetical protein